ncbi:hypothetical protein BJ085DRAFT_299, partial [Dimargaris cristalligena]
LTMSTSKGSTGARKSGQKYQNTTAYTHNRNSRRTREILALPVNGLCQKCHDTIQWRKTYRKYKPLTVPKKCTKCDQKKIKDAYHIICGDCAAALKVCAKCRESREIVVSDDKTPQQLVEEEQRTQHILQRLSERQRRTLQRKLDRGE